MKTPLWHIEEFVAATGGRLKGDFKGEINGISIDSRTLEKSDAFFSINGPQFDGHDFVEDAFSAGASIAVVSEKRLPDMPANRPYVVVEDALEALTSLGMASRSRTIAMVIAVTGSVGKTSTKEALGLALSKSGRTHVSALSYNNHWGVPLSLARMPTDTEFAVFELGMNAPGEIKFLSGLVQPHIAIITVIAEAHLESFNSIEDISRAKAEIFLSLQPNGTAVLNADCGQIGNLVNLAKQAGVKKIIKFGASSDADARVAKSVMHVNCSCVTASILGVDVTYKIGAPGGHLIGNTLAVLAAVKLAGANLAKGALALSEVKLPKGRGNRCRLMLPKGEALLIDESYNANPLSMAAAIKSLGEVPVKKSGRHMAVLGDMLELGPTAPKLHASLAGHLKNAEIDTVYCVGPQMQCLWEVLPQSQRGAYFAESSELEPVIHKDIRSGDVVMVKGSLGTRMGPIVESLKQKYGKSRAAAED